MAGAWYGFATAALSAMRKQGRIQESGVRIQNSAGTKKFEEKIEIVGAGLNLP